MAFGSPGGNAGNTYVATLELSGHLMVNFSRNLKKSVNRYSRITPVKQKRGAYLRFNPHDLARMPNPETEFAWAPGTPAPGGFGINQGFEEQNFNTKRYSFGPTNLDSESVDVANWDVKKAYADLLAQTAMTHRIYKVTRELTTTANFAATHVATATALAGGFLDGGTTADPRIKKALDAAATIIQKDTYGRVRWGQLSVLINNNTALKWSQSRELREYLMQNPEAVKEITLDDSNLNAAYALPAKLYGFKIVVEDTYYNTANKGNASEQGTPVYPDNTATVFLAEGDLESEGPYSFNTCHVFAYEEMTVEEKADAWNRLVEMRVVMNYDTKIVAPATGFIITNLFS